MRPHLLALAALSSLFLVASARADEPDDPAEPAPSSTDLPPLPPLAPLPDLPALPDLAPLDLAPTHTPAPELVPTPTPTLSPAPAPAPTLSLSTAPSAVLGQYDEYKRPIAAYSIDAEPVTIAAYDRCTAAGQCTRPSCDTASRSARVTCVDLAQARSYCAFAGERLPSEDEWEHAARSADTLGMHAVDDAAEWTSTPYCFFCGKDDQVVRGGPARNPALRGWRPPTTRDAAVGFRCARTG